MLTENPASGVPGPDRGNKKAKTYLYPSELIRLVSCDMVPLLWRRMYALAAYLFVRASELDVLGWDDFDMATSPPTVRIHRAWDEERQQTKPTKNNGTRTFTVEPALVPLLAAMHKEAGGTGRVVDVPRGRRHSENLREHLLLAGVKRASLFTNDATRKHITFHDLKATGVTWMAVRGDRPLRIMKRAAHHSFATTLDYIRDTEEVAQGFGDVFPELPQCLLRDEPEDDSSRPLLSESSCESSLESSQGAQLSDIIAERVGFEPTVRFRTHDFQSCTFDHSVTSPALRPA